MTIVDLLRQMNLSAEAVVQGDNEASRPFALAAYERALDLLERSRTEILKRERDRRAGAD